jgi:hypothetical protein
VIFSKSDIQKTRRLKIELRLFSKRSLFNVIRNHLLAYENIREIDGIRGLILDVGSGHNPFPFAHVLCDLYDQDNSQRMGYKLRTVHKPFIKCDAQHLPFRNKSFDLIHISHVLEHVSNPKLTLMELKRVGKRIHLETPTWLRETFFSGDCYHKWIIFRRKGQICVRRPIVGFNLKLDRLPFFNSFEYLMNKLFPMFILKVDIECASA